MPAEIAGFGNSETAQVDHQADQPIALAISVLSERGEKLSISASVRPKTAGISFAPPSIAPLN